MEYINKNTGDKINHSTYLQLSEEGKRNFITLSAQNNSTTDVLGLGKAAETIAMTAIATPFLIKNFLDL